jgi:hypothetical protein
VSVMVGNVHTSKPSKIKKKTRWPVSLHKITILTRAIPFELEFNSHNICQTMHTSTTK